MESPIGQILTPTPFGGAGPGAGLDFVVLVLACGPAVVDFAAPGPVGLAVAEFAPPAPSGPATAPLVGCDDEGDPDTRRLATRPPTAIKAKPTTRPTCHVDHLRSGLVNGDRSLVGITRRLRCGRLPGHG